MLSRGIGGLEGECETTQIVLALRDAAADLRGPVDHWTKIIHPVRYGIWFTHRISTMDTYAHGQPPRNHYPIMILNLPPLVTQSAPFKIKEYDAEYKDPTYFPWGFLCLCAKSKSKLDSRPFRSSCDTARR